ncbi:MAG: hypothetical protein KDB14_04445 [Planctomycetales bacterium]|nr:hypothetical protein [Planctomycetales bacterium]
MSTVQSAERIRGSFDESLQGNPLFDSTFPNGTFDFGPEGMRIRWNDVIQSLPPCQFRSKFGLQGDFEVVLWVSPHELGIPAGGWGNGVMLRIDFKDQRRSGVSVHRMAQADGTQVFSADHTAEGMANHDVRGSTVEREIEAMVVRRIGDRLLVASITESREHPLCEFSVTRADVHPVSFHVHTGRSVGALDVSLRGFEIEADEVVSAQTLKRRHDDSKLFVAATAWILLMCLTFARLRRKQDAPETSNALAADRPILNVNLGDLAYGWVLAAALFALADYRKQHPGPSQWLRPDLSGQLGAENDTIAVSLRQGEGFANVFHEQTGPTAWMPPLLPCLTAGLYWLWGDHRQSVVETVRVLNALVIVLSATIVMALCRRLRVPRWLGATVLTAGLLADFFELYQRTHDTWLILLELNFCMLGACWLWRKTPTMGRTIAWGVFGGACALTSPVCGFVWASLTTLCWWPLAMPRPSVDRTPRGAAYAARPLVTAALVSMVAVAPWVIRNKMALGKWTPIKSNGLYEVWQSQVLDDDGVLDSSSAFQHPWGSHGAQRERYAEVGEIAFVAERWEPTIASIRNDPVEVLRRISNRWWAATLYYQPMVPSDESLIWPMRGKRAFFPIPFLALLTVLSLRRRLEPELLVAINVYLALLGPYVAISYYDRYAAPAVVAKLLIVLYAIDTLRPQKRQPPVQEETHAAVTVAEPNSRGMRATGELTVVPYEAHTNSAR